jgi:hypothetical protein
VDHARMICNAITDWVSAPNMADGDVTNFPPLPVTTAGKDGKMFSEHFPSEAGWMAAGIPAALGADQYYQYFLDTTVGGTLPLGGSPSNPAILGQAWGGAADPAVYGYQVQAGGIGIGVGAPDLTGCKSNVEVISTQY